MLQLGDKKETLEKWDGNEKVEGGRSKAGK